LGVLTVLFFIASAYGVQRTILSTYAGENVDVTLWFETGAWLSVAFTLAGFGLFKAFSGFLSGPSISRYGIRYVIISGAGLFTLGSMVILFSRGELLIVGIGNSFLGAGEGLLYAGAMLYLSNIGEISKRAQWLGLMEFAVYAGYSFGALFSGFLTMLTGILEASFVFSIIISSLGLILAIFSARSITQTGSQIELEKIRTTIPEEEKKNVFQLLSRPTVVITFLSGHISKMVDSIIVLYLPLVLSHNAFGYGLSIEATGVIISSFTLAWAITMPFSGRISDSIGRKIPIIFGFLLEAGALFGFSWGSSPFLILLLLSALGGVGVGLYYPILPTISVDITNEEQKSYVIGFFRSFKDLGYFTGPLLAGFVASLWYNDVSQNLSIILRLPLTLASFILLFAGLGLLFFVRETRPGWGQFETTLIHAQMVEESVIAATKGILIYLEQETIDATVFHQKLAKSTSRAKELEVEADSKLEEIVVQTYQTLHKSPDAGNFLRIARRLDRVAGLSLGALYRLQRIPNESIPPLIQEKLHDAAIALRSLIRTTVDILKVLEIKIDAVTAVYHVIRDRESELDLLYQIMNRQLFISASHMEYGIWFEIKDVINMIEQAADSAEDAAEVINILAIKYKT
jgi:DHA1 family multidrug resistance protein-like MFS transporter